MPTNRWNKLHKFTGEKIGTWSHGHGNLNSSFYVKEVTNTNLTVETPKGTQRVVTRADFEWGEEIWDDYINGRIPRTVWQKSVNSTYIISLIHRLDSEAEAAAA